MKTTLEVPDALLKKVKSTAARHGQTMGAFINAAIEAKLKADESARKEKPWMRFAGVFSDRRDESSKILKVIEEDCGKVRPEDWE